MTAAAVDATLFRTCGFTGKKVHRDAEWLVKVNAVVAVVALLVGAIAALLLVLTRWQAAPAPGHLRYRLLGVHGMNMLISFIIFFEMAVLWFASTALLDARPAAPRLGKAMFALMVLGALIVEWTQWTGRADVLFTSYPRFAGPPRVLPRGHPIRGSGRGRDLLRR
ncbi:MAG: cbb3-type cytochrome c oxidase subunit I [Gemmatimonadaceae bacterium]